MEATEHEEMRKMCEKHDELISIGNKLTRNFFPIVYYRIPAVGLSRHRYYDFLKRLLADFMESCDLKNKREAEVIKIRGLDRLNEESGIGMIYINGHFIAHCKMYICDGTAGSKKHNPNHEYKTWRGLMFRDHADTNPEYNTAKVFLIADALEKFLVSKNIKFTRVNQKR